jgi:hypothetical protein
MKSQNVKKIYNQQSINNNSQTLKERSTVMFKSLFYSLVALVVLTGLTFSQNLVIQAGSSFSGNGVYNIKGDITNAEAKTISGTVNLTGTGAQSIGTTGNALTFHHFNPQGSGTKTQNVTVTAESSFTISGTANYDINGQTLNLDGSATRVSGTLTANGASSTTNYRKSSGSQTIIDATYTNLNLSNGALKSLQGDVTAATMTHTGGNLNVNNNLSITGAATLAIIDSVYASKVLSFGSSASSVDSVSLNLGRINGGSGSLAFTNGVNNSGKIVGSSGNMSFNGILNNLADSVKGGSGGITFNGNINNNATIYAEGTDSLDFNGNVANNATGLIRLANTGRASFSGTFTSTAGTINLDATSNWYYDGGNQTVSGGLATYGNLYMTGTPGSTKTVAGNITVLGNFDNGGPTNLDITTDFGVDSLLGTDVTERFNENGTILFGGAGNGLIFTTGTVNYNAAAGTQIVDGHATANYETLIFSGGGTKEISAGVRVGTSAGLNINSGVTAHIVATGQLLVGLTAGDLTNAGTINNEGTVQIGQ